MARRIIPHGTSTAMAAALLAMGEVVVNETTGNLHVGDGATPGGKIAGAAQADAILTTLGGNDGATKVKWLMEGVGAIPRTLAAKLADLEVYVRDFGAVGNATADDTAAIQAALDFVGANGGGIVKLSPRRVYRVTDTLRLPSYVVLEGCTVTRYPYAGGDPKNGGIVADFVNPMKWVIEAATTKKVAGSPRYAYNEFVSGALDSCNPSYNCGVRDLFVFSKNTIPYGGIKLHGAPGATVDNFGCVGVGCGGILNYSFDARIRAHTMGLYYGWALWDDINACEIILYVAQDASNSKTVPNNYRLPFMAALDGTLVGASAMATDSHTTRAWGILVGSTNSNCVNNDLRVVSERYAGGVFMKNTQGTEFTRFYVEGSTNVMEYAIAGTQCSFNIRAFHAFMSGTGTLMDFGAGVVGSIEPGGINSFAQLGTGPWFGDNSRIVFRNCSPDDLGNDQYNKTRVFPDIPGKWHELGAAGEPTFTEGWSQVAGAYPVAFRVNRDKLEIRGQATGGAYGSGVFVLPAKYRPSKSICVPVGQGGTVYIDPATGKIIAAPTGAACCLDGISTTFY